MAKSITYTGLLSHDGLNSVGYGELIRRFSIEAMPHYCTSYLSPRGGRKTYATDNRIEEVYPSAYNPGDTWQDHLTFALKYEGFNLEILACLFEKIDQSELADMVKAAPFGKYSRIIWYLYEFLTGKMLDLEDLKPAPNVDLLDPEKYYTARGVVKKRQRINDNLLGDRRFSPLVRRTQALAVYEAEKLDEKAAAVIKNYPAEVLKRALLYLYTKETKSSFEIERVDPDTKRADKFVELLRLAEQKEFFNKRDLVQLQQATVDPRYANSDFRTTQNYVGQTVRLGQELVHFVPPKPEDINDLMEGMFLAYGRTINSAIHPVVTAAVISFGFVFMHPFDDGNGRIHRFLIHNILAKKGFSPPGLIFPVSATMLKKMPEYDQTLESFSQPLMPLIDYQLDEDCKMTVKNDTALRYRYMDMTTIVERMFGFIKETVETELASELDYILDYDKAKLAIRGVVDMPDQRIDLFIRLCEQNNGKLSIAKRQSKFSQLTEDEVSRMENCVQEAFRKQSTGTSLTA